MASFTPKKLNLTELNSGQRYNNGDVVSAESVNAPIEGTAYAQSVAEVAEKKATLRVRNVTTSTALPSEQAAATAVVSYVSGASNSNLDFTFRIPQGKQGRCITPRSSWLSGVTYYFTADTVDTVMHNGNQYSTKITHTSSSANAPPNATYWQLFASKGDTGGTFTPSVSTDAVISWTNDKGLVNPPSNSSIKNALGNVNTTMSGYMQQTTERVDELEQDIIEKQGTKVTVGSVAVKEWNADAKISVSEKGVASGVATLNLSGNLAQKAVLDETGSNIVAKYLPRTNGTASGYLALDDVYSKITRAAISPAGNNIGVNGIMLTHSSGDEGGLLINEDGAYLWNSTDSGSILKGMDEDSWTKNTGMKKDCTFDNGLLFDFDSDGNLKLKGKVYQDNGEIQLNGQVLWTGQSSSVDPSVFQDSNWKTKYSALLVNLSGSNDDVIVASIKNKTSNSTVNYVSARFNADYDIVFYSFNLNVPINSGSFYLSQRYISWQSNTKTWSLNTPQIAMTRIVGLV